jgi:Spy/CpxP family protein refolding chaperone
MKRLLCGTGLALALVLATGVGAQDKGKPPPGGPPAFGPFQMMMRPLLPPPALEKLDLSADQKAEVEKLQKEFRDKLKPLDDLRETMEKAAKDRDPDAMRKAQEQMRELAQSLTKHREEAEAKLAKVLNKEQLQKFEEIKRQQPGFGPGPGPIGGPPIPGGGFRLFPGQLVMPPVEQMLKLSAEQKEKIAKVQKEAEDKVMEILTDEQKKTVERMKKGFGPPGGPPGGGPPPRD